MTKEVQPAHNEKRNAAVRVLCGILWFFPIHILSSAIIGGMVGAFGASAVDATHVTSFEESYAAGKIAGHAAAAQFFAHYGWLVLLATVLLTIGLSWKGILPGTGRTKKARRVDPNQSFR